VDNGQSRKEAADSRVGDLAGEGLAAQIAAWAAASAAVVARYGRLGMSTRRVDGAGWAEAHLSTSWNTCLEEG